MPSGVNLVESGRLMLDRGRPVLLRDDGGCWRLFLDCRAEHLLGQRVTVRANRDGFDLLHVSAIAQGSMAPPQPTLGQAFDNFLIVTMILSALLCAAALIGLVF